jgi:succinate dehydrogenase/fumarate reductase flavoprotein subunit
MILQTLYQQCVKRNVRFFNEFYVLDQLMVDGVCAGVVAYELATASSTSSAPSRSCTRPAATAGCSRSPRTPTR